MKSATTCTLRVLPGQLIVGRFKRTNWLTGACIEVESNQRPFGDTSSLVRSLPKLLKDLHVPGQRLSVVISDSLCRYLSLSRPSGSASVRELDALAQARFNAAFGEDPSDWVLATDRPVRSPNDLLVAIPRVILSALEEGIRNASFQIDEIVPLWVRCANATPPQRRNAHWLIASEPTAHTIGLFEKGHCVGVRRVRRTPADALHEILARELPLYENATLAQQVWLWGEPPRIETSALPQGFQIVEGKLPNGVPDLMPLLGAPTTQVSE